MIPNESTNTTTQLHETEQLPTASEFLSRNEHEKATPGADKTDQIADLFDSNTEGDAPITSSLHTKFAQTFVPNSNQKHLDLLHLEGQASKLSIVIVTK